MAIEFIFGSRVETWSEFLVLRRMSLVKITNFFSTIRHVASVFSRNFFFLCYFWQFSGRQNVDNLRT